MTSTNLPAAVCYIAPPAYDDIASQPIIYVWGSRNREHRKTVPRGFGSKEGFYSIDIWLKWAGQVGDPQINDSFALLIDAVMQKLRSVAVPTLITDPDTSAQSQLLEVGETMESVYSIPHAAADQRFLIFEALIVCDTKEWFQA